MSELVSQRKIRRIAQQEGVDPDVFAALIQQESGRRKVVGSPAGARGPAQLMPGTARSLGVNIDDPLQNVRGGARYLRQQLKAFGGDYSKALAAYNAGPGAVQKYHGIPPYAETQNYVKTITAAARGANGGVEFRTGQGGGSGALLEASAGASAPAGVPQGSEGLVSLLAALGERPAPRASAGLPLPAFAAAPAMPAGFQSPASGGGPEAKPDLGALLDMVRTQGGDVPAAPGADQGGQVLIDAAGGQVIDAPKAAGGLDFPLAKRGKIIGVPYQGTHTDFNNWQSDNAIDVAVPTGTPVVAVADGVIGKQIGPLNSSSPQLAGQRVYVEGKGNQWYYAHLSKLAVKPGQRVRKGQVIGYSGAANGVEHLHIASERGNPLREFGQPRGRR